MPPIHSSSGQAADPQIMVTPASTSSPRHSVHKGNSRPSKFSRPRWSSPPRVLLVDDDVVYRMLSGRLLKVFGCVIDTANDGSVAVDALKMNVGKYDLVFMDIMMPKLDGISATSLIRQFDDMTPIISVTSNSLPSEILTYYSSGMNDVLPKPFTRDGLYNILEKHLVHLKTIHDLSSASNSPHVSEHTSLPPLSTTSTSRASVLTLPRSPPHLFGSSGSGMETTSDAGDLFFVKPMITPVYPRSTPLAPGPSSSSSRASSSSSASSSHPPSRSHLPSSSTLSSPSEDDDPTRVPATSPTSSDPDEHRHGRDSTPYLVPQSPQTPQSQSSTLVDGDAVPEDDFSPCSFHLKCTAQSSSPDCALRTPRSKRPLDESDLLDSDLDSGGRERKRGKVEV